MYTGKQKAEALIMLAQGKSIREVAEEIDIPKSTIGRWRLKSDNITIEGAGWQALPTIKKTEDEMSDNEFGLDLSAVDELDQQLQENARTVDGLTMQIEARRQGLEAIRAELSALEDAEADEIVNAELSGETVTPNEQRTEKIEKLRGQVEIQPAVLSRLSERLESAERERADLNQQRADAVATAYLDAESALIADHAAKAEAFLRSAQRMKAYYEEKARNVPSVRFRGLHQLPNIPTGHVNGWGGEQAIRQMRQSLAPGGLPAHLQAGGGVASSASGRSVVRAA